MPAVDFAPLVVVLAVALVTPLLAGWIPGPRIPESVLEVAAGAVLGPSVLGWVSRGPVIDVLAVFGLAFLLFLIGIEVDVRELRGPPLSRAAAGFAAAAVAAFAIGGLLGAVGLVASGAFIAVALLSTSPGLVTAVLRRAGREHDDFGKVVLGGAALDTLACALLLSLLFTGAVRAVGTRIALLVVFGGVVAAAAFGLWIVDRWGPLHRQVERLEQTSSEVRVRAAVLLLVGLVAAGSRLGVEVVIGAFVAGAVLRAVDRRELLCHPTFTSKLEAVGYGLLIPVFFVAAGISLDLRAVMVDGRALALLPILTAALVAVHFVGGLVQQRGNPRRDVVAAALLQASTFPFLVAAVRIGLSLELLTPSNAAALVLAAVVSAVAFPRAAEALLRPLTHPRG